MLVNINTALADITKPSAINTEEWPQLGIRFNGGHCNRPASPHPSFSYVVPSLCCENGFHNLRSCSSFASHMIHLSLLLFHHLSGDVTWKYSDLFINFILVFFFSFLASCAAKVGHSWLLSDYVQNTFTLTNIIQGFFAVVTQV